MQYKRQPLKFVSGGVDINNPVDLQPPGKFPYLKNVQAYQDGHMETRAPLSKINSAATSDLLMLSSFRLNDYVVADFTRFLKINSKLYFGKTSFSLADSGYSNTLPLSYVPWQPDQSPEPWAYIADNTRMRKVKVDGTNYAIGIAPPTIIPTAELAAPIYTIPAIFDALTHWSGTTGGQAVAARLTGITIGTIKYISGTTGWAGIIPANGDPQDLSAGMVITLNSGGGNAESVVVEEIIRVFDPGSNTINQILYDSGTSGLCTIMPTKPLGGLKRNAILQLGGSEYVRVISVTNSTSGISSFRCSTSGTFAATNAIAAPANGNLWVYLTGTHAAAETITNNGIDTNVAANTFGTEAYNLGASGLNLSVVGGRSISPDDFLHMSFHVGSPENLSFIRLVLDVDPGTTATYAATDGQNNAYYVDIRPNDLQAIIASNTTIDAARQAALAKQALNQTPLDFSTNQPSVSPFGTGQGSPTDMVAATPTSPAEPLTVNPTGQLIAGAFQWSEYKCRIADLIRIGASVIVDLANVRAIQIRVFTNANTTGGPVGAGGTFLHWGGLWVGGTYGPDTSLGNAPLIYRYRYRSSATGAKSLPGPAMRSGIQAFRQAIVLTATASGDAQVDKIDFERFGAQNLQWNFVAEVSNSSPTFTDEQLSAAIVADAGLDTDAFQPFPIADTPKSSTVTVAGTAILKTGGDAFDTSWARGTEVYINGVLTELYASPTSTTLLHVADAMPSGTGITMTVPAPIKAGQPLPYMWGPFFNCMFACGNILDAGAVYYTKPGDPDSAPDTNRIEVTSPSEVMVGGCVYDGRAYCWSDKRMFSIIPSFADPSQFQFVVVPNGRGLWSPYAIAVGPRIWYLAADGIYESDGGSSVCITDDIKPLFFQDDVPGFAAHNMFPIQMTKDGSGNSFIHRLRLAYHDDMLIFDYIDCKGTSLSLAYDVRLKGWFPYQYLEGASKNVIFHASEQAVESSNLATHLVAGTDAGFLYEAGASGSGDETINCTIRTPAIDAGDSRAKKIWGDIVLDMNSQGVPVVCTPYINNYLTALPSKTYITLQRQITDPIDLSSGVGQFGRNLGLDISWTLST